MESIISDFHVDWHLLLAQLFNFSVVVAVLYFFAFKPLVKIMGERTDKIAKGLQDAEDSSLKLESAELETQSLLREARKQGDAVVAEADRQAAANQAAVLEKTKQQVKTVVEQEKEKIALEREQVMAEMKVESAALAISLAEQLLGKKMDAKSDEDFINKITK